MYEGLPLKLSQSAGISSPLLVLTGSNNFKSNRLSLLIADEKYFYLIWHKYCPKRQIGSKKLESFSGVQE
jgi:hypothetical protein